VRVDKYERVQRQFIRYNLCDLGWTDTYDLPPYEHRCALLRLGTLVKRRSIACVMFIFDILRGRMNSSNLLSAFYLKTPRFRTRVPSFGFDRTNYGVQEPMSAAYTSSTRLFLVCSISLTRNQFMNRLKLTL
jgi:hypothetical protein